MNDGSSRVLAPMKMTSRASFFGSCVGPVSVFGFGLVSNGRTAYAFYISSLGSIQ